MHALKHEWYTRHSKDLERSIITYLMTGSTTVVDKPEFAALADGFKSMGSNGPSTQDLFDQLRAGADDENFRGMISFVYDTSVTNIEQVLQHLTFSSQHDTGGATPSPNWRADCDLADSIFTHMLLAWVRGIGHPDDEQVRTTLALALARNIELQPEHYKQARAQIRRSQGDPFFRAKLLLLAVTGSERRSLDLAWQIRVRAPVLLSLCSLSLRPLQFTLIHQQMNVTTLTNHALAHLVNMTPANVRISVCASTVRVKMTLPLLRMLSVPAQSSYSEFDVWFHCQMIWACGLDIGYDLS